MKRITHDDFRRLPPERSDIELFQRKLLSVFWINTSVFIRNLNKGVRNENKLNILMVLALVAALVGGSTGGAQASVSAVPAGGSWAAGSVRCQRPPARS